jgi:hypothetical protein
VANAARIFRATRQFATQGIDALTATRVQFGAHIRDEIAKCARVMQAPPVAVDSTSS